MRRSFFVQTVGAVAVALAVTLAPSAALAAPSPTSTAAGPITAQATAAQIEAAIAYGQSKVGKSLYTGCAAGSYRMGATTTYERHFDGRTCGQSYIYVLRPGYYGFDCSGLIYKMFQAAGVSFPYTSSTQMKNSLPRVTKSYSTMRRGDLLVKYGHVAMYLGRTADGVPWALEASPKKVLEQDGIWRVAEGVMAVDARPYFNSSEYTAHRV